LGLGLGLEAAERAASVGWEVTAFGLWPAEPPTGGLSSMTISDELAGWGRQTSDAYENQRPHLVPGWVHLAQERWWPPALLASCQSMGAQM
jgi:hypothetical protein